MSVWNKIYALRAQFIVNSLTSGSFIFRFVVNARARAFAQTHTHTLGVSVRSFLRFLFIAPRVYRFDNVVRSFLC